MSSYIKDPEATLDFSQDWSAWLADGETLTAATVTAADGITKSTAETFTPEGVVTVWVSGGTVGTVYRLTFHITTSAGREDERSMTIAIRER